MEPETAATVRAATALAHDAIRKLATPTLNPKPDPH